MSLFSQRSKFHYLVFLINSILFIIPPGLRCDNVSHHIGSHQLEKVCSTKVGFPLPSLSFSLFFLPSPPCSPSPCLPFFLCRSLSIQYPCGHLLAAHKLYFSAFSSLFLSFSLFSFYLFCMMFVTLKAASIDGTVSDLKEASLGFLYPKTTKISLEFLIFSTLFLAPGGLPPPGRLSHADTN